MRSSVLLAAAALCAVQTGASRSVLSAEHEFERLKAEAHTLGEAEMRSRLRRLRELRLSDPPRPHQTKVEHVVVSSWRTTASTSCWAA